MKPLHLLAVLSLATSCTFEVPRTRIYCGETALAVGETTPAGLVALDATLTQADAEAATVTVGWRLAEDDPWTLATLEGETTALASSPEGTAHALGWNAAADLGSARTDGLALRLVASSACGVWEAAIVEDLSIDTSGVAEAACDVSVLTPDDPEDGRVTVEFSTAHADSTPVYVAATWSADGGKSWSNLTLSQEDCDGDGEADGLTSLSTSPRGEPHCLVWDSQADFASDEQVIVRLGCGVAYAEQSSDQTEGFSVENDPTVGAGEVIFSEVMPESSFSSGDYLELYNTTDHTLNLDGLLLQRWKAGLSPNTAGPTRELELSDTEGTLLIDPGARLLLAETADEEENGCLDPDLTWGSAFSLADNSTLRLVRQRETLAELDITDEAGWSFSEGVAMGLDPDAHDNEDWNSLSRWCAQSSAVPACESWTAAQTDQGTPGAENDACD